MVGKRINLYLFLDILGVSFMLTMVETDQLETYIG